MTSLAERSCTRTVPTLRREAITWRSVGELVEISLELANDSCERTEPDMLVIEAAPFGAFVPNLPITSIAVAAMDPGERRTETLTVERAVLDRVSSRFSNLLRNAPGADGLVKPEAHLHWIGNLNVYFQSQPDRAVERHCAFGLRVPAGSRILSAFMVEEWLDCRFEVVCSSEAWIGEMLPVGAYTLISVLTPDKVAEQAHVTVNVMRESDGRVVPVEFDFETVEGWGDALGCVKV